MHGRILRRAHLRHVATGATMTFTQLLILAAVGFAFVMPFVVLVFARAGESINTDAAYTAGYRQGVHDTTDLARGLARHLPEHEPTIIVETPARYTLARPFALPGATVDGEVR